MPKQRKKRKSKGLVYPKRKSSLDGVFIYEVLGQVFVNPRCLEELDWSKAPLAVVDHDGNILWRNPNAPR